MEIPETQANLEMCPDVFAPPLQTYYKQNGTGITHLADYIKRKR